MATQAVIAVFDSVDEARSAVRGLASAQVTGVELRAEGEAPGNACVVSIDVAAAGDVEHIAELMRQRGARRVKR